MNLKEKMNVQQLVLKIAKNKCNKEKRVSENIFFNEKSYLKIPLLKTDLTYTIKKNNVYLLIFY